jgi:uncharacterized membrane protein YfcA
MFNITTPYILIPIAALLASCLTLFSGFGLGTLLTPVFVLFFPIEVAISITAIVHLANNIFKLFLVGKTSNKKIILAFGIPAIITAILGALLLNSLSTIELSFSYSLLGINHEVKLIKAVIGILIIAFAALELIPWFSKLSFDKKYLPLGGIISGFFGGLSGNQGALRSAFLIKSGISKEEFIGTGVVVAVLVDVTRLIVYGAGFYSTNFSVLNSNTIPLIITATLFAFIGAVIGTKLLKKITLRLVQIIIAIMMILIGAGMIAGFV